MGKIITTEMFRDTMKSIHGEKYDIVGVYKDAHTHCEFKCNTCGLTFSQTPNHLKKRSICPCETNNEIIPFSKINESLTKASNGKYSIEEKDYVSSNKKAKMTCSEHGEFFASPYSVISGRKIGCDKCSTTTFTSKVRKTTEEFIEDAKKVHGDTYDYSQVEYTTAQNNVNIICKKHGLFSQRANNHLKRGCPSCARCK